MLSIRLLTTLVAIMSSLLLARPAQACTCEDAMAVASQHVWDGEALQESDHVELKTCEDLRVLRNTVYARHGYIFGEEWVKAQFDDDPRYVPDAYVGDETVGAMLTPSDRVTVELILAAEAKDDCSHYWEKKALPDPFDPERIQVVTITPVEPETPAERTFVEVPLPTAPLTGGAATVSVVAGVMTSEFVTHQAFDAKMIESSWLAQFTCDELDRVIHAVYARHNFYFLNGETRTYFLRFDLRYRPDMNLRVTEIEATFTSQDQLTLLRAEVALENHSCSQE